MTDRTLTDVLVKMRSGCTLRYTLHHYWVLEHPKARSVIIGTAVAHKVIAHPMVFKSVGTYKHRERWT